VLGDSRLGSLPQRGVTRAWSNAGQLATYIRSASEGAQLSSGTQGWMRQAHRLSMLDARALELNVTPTRRNWRAALLAEVEFDRERKLRFVLNGLGSKVLGSTLQRANECRSRYCCSDRVSVFSFHCRTNSVKRSRCGRVGRSRREVPPKRFWRRVPASMVAYFV
jgi:hypothetical protein